MFELKNILFEIGEGSLDPYEFKKVSEPSVRKGEYAFHTGETQYLVDFEFENSEELDGTANTLKFHILGEENNYMTDENKTLKVITTVMKIAEYHVKKYLLDSGISYLIFGGVSKGEGGSVNTKTQRSRIYKRFLERSFPNLEVSEKRIGDSKYFVIDLNSIN